MNRRLRTALEVAGIFSVFVGSCVVIALVVEAVMPPDKPGRKGLGGRKSVEMAAMTVCGGIAGRAIHRRVMP